MALPVILVLVHVVLLGFVILHKYMNQSLRTTRTTETGDHAMNHDANKKKETILNSRFRRTHKTIETLAYKNDDIDEKYVRLFK